jgi:hypothetical protein
LGDNGNGPDSDIDGTLVPSTTIAVTGTSDGTLVNNGDGTFDYTPNLGFVGTDSFSYTVEDDEGAVSNTGSVTITVSNSIQTIDVQITTSSDDVEERSSGSVVLASSDLELVNDGTRLQTVGLRFPGIGIPQFATIVDAYMQFQVDEVDSGVTSFVIHGEDIGDAATFSATTNNVTSRETTSASVAWSPAAWTVVGEAGLAQQTPPLVSVIQEIVGRVDWVSGNSLALIVSGSGERTAEAADGDASGAPRLIVNFVSSDSSPVIVETPVAVVVPDAATPADESTTKIVDSMGDRFATLLSLTGHFDKNDSGLGRSATTLNYYQGFNDDATSGQLAVVDRDMWFRAEVFSAVIPEFSLAQRTDSKGVKDAALPLQPLRISGDTHDSRRAINTDPWREVALDRRAVDRFFESL